MDVIFTVYSVPATGLFIVTHLVLGEPANPGCPAGQLYDKNPSGAHISIEPVPAQNSGTSISKGKQYVSKYA